MGCLIPFVYLSFMTGNLTILLKKRFEEVLPSAIMISGLILYLTAFFKKLSVGFYFLVLVSICFPFVLIIKKIKGKEILDYLKRLLTPGFLVFCAVYLEIYFLNLNRGFTEWDEFSHWGPMVKEILRLDTFYSDPASMSLTHQDYPPAIALVEVLWCKLAGIFGEGYSEKVLYRALQTFILSMYIPVFKEMNWKDISRKNILPFTITYSLILLSIQLVIPLGEAKIYSTIYTDGAMAVIFAYSVFIIIVNKCMDGAYYFQVAVALTFLLLTKQIALALYLLAVGIFVMNLLIDRGVKKQILSINKLFCVAISFFAIPQFFSSLWNYYINNLKIKGQFSISSIRVNSLMAIICGNGGEDWQHTVFINFLDKFCHTKLKSSPLSLTYWQLIIVLGVLLFLAGKFNTNLNLRKKIYLLDICMVLGGIAYACAMLLLYIYVFGEYEGTRIVCYARYMGTYIFSFFSMIVMVFIYKNQIADAEVFSLKKAVIALGMIFIVLVPTKHINQLLPILTNNSVTQDLLADEEIIIANTEKNAKIYLISQWNNGYDMFRLSYLTLPRTYNRKGYSLGEKYYDDDIWTQDLNPSIWKDSLQEYDYLYLKHVDEQFINKYGFVFSQDSCLQDGQIYKINKEGGEDIVLELLSMIQ